MANTEIIFEETAEVVEQLKFEADQFVTIIKAKKSSQTAKPGQFAFVECGGNTLLRRPLSYLRTSKEKGTIEFMYKTLGPGLEALSQIKPGDEIRVMGPIGNGFMHPSNKKSVILIGGGVGIPPVLFMGEELKKANHDIDLVAFFGSEEVPFPFQTCKSSLAMPGVNDDIDKSIDDRVPGSEWEQLTSPVQVVFLEGWCMGAMAQPVDELAEPVNPLEVREDSDGRWRNYVNNSLAEHFSQLYRRVDRWVMLQAPSFDCVYQWRLEQEQKLALTRSGNAIMSAAEIAHFIQFYQRLTEHCLARLPARVDHLYRLDKQRRIQSYTSAAEANV